MLGFGRSEAIIIRSKIVDAAYLRKMKRDGSGGFFVITIVPARLASGSLELGK